MLPMTELDGQPTSGENSLNEAVKALRKKVDAGNLIIFVDVGHEEGNPDVRKLPQYFAP